MIVRLPQPKETGYYKASNELLRDRRLSYGARGVLLYLLSHTDDWKISITNLENEVSDSARPIKRDAIYAILAELESVGYVARVQERGSDGRMLPQNWYVGESPEAVGASVKSGTDSPYTEKPYTEKPYTEKPYTEKPTQRNTIKTSITEKEHKTKKEKSDSPCRADAPKAEKREPDQRILPGNCQRPMPCGCSDCKASVGLIAKNLRRWHDHGIFGRVSRKTLHENWSTWNTSHDIRQVLTRLAAEIRAGKHSADSSITTAIDGILIDMDSEIAQATSTKNNLATSTR